MQMENKKRMPQQAPQAKADKAPAEQDTALVWGKNPVSELLKSEAGVDTLLLADSMEPRMLEGDVVICRQTPDVESGATAVVLVNGDEATVKKLMKHKNGISLVANNPAYPPMFYTFEECESLPVRVVGQVIELRAKAF